MAKAATLAADLLTKRQALQAEFDKHKNEQGEYDIPSDQVAAFRARNEELNTLGKSWEDARDVEAIAAANTERLKSLSEPDDSLPLGISAKGGDGASAKGEPAPMGLGELFAKGMYERDRSGRLVTGDGDAPVCRKGVDRQLAYDPVRLKATMTTSAGFAPENLRSGRVQLSAQRPIRLLDFVTMIPVGVNNNAYVYMEETTHTNASAEIAENSPTGAPESALAFNEKSKPIRRVATFLPVTDEQLRDVSGMQALIDSRLAYMVRNRLESQLVAGTGVGVNIDGYLNQVAQTQAKGTDPVFDAIFKAIVKCQTVGYSDPDAMLLHPNDWSDIRLTRTADGIYILGNPGDSVVERLFGLPVVSTTAMTENTALVGAYAEQSAMIYNQGVEMKVSDSHSDYFIKFLQAIRVSLRAALVVFRPDAFCKATGI